MAGKGFNWHPSQQDQRINNTWPSVVVFSITMFFPAFAQFSRLHTARVYMGPWTFFQLVSRDGDEQHESGNGKTILRPARVSPQRNDERKRSKGGEGERRAGEGSERARGTFVNAARSAFKPICMTRRQACTFELRSRARDFDKC